MWIVRIALNRPYTFVVMALAILFVGPLAIVRTPTDIFPNINIPVVTVVWVYGGLSAEELSQRIVSGFERGMTTTVSDIEHIESQTLRGTSIVKVFFQPGAKTEAAVAQISSISQSALRMMPPGTNPPFIITYNASTVPILQLGLSGNGLSEQQLYDLAVNFIRVQLATVQGASVPNPYGGKQAQIQVDLDPRALQAKGLAPTDVVNAIAVQNLILPGGTSKIGGYEYDVRLHGSPDTVEELNDLPIRTSGTPIYIRDVAHVRNGFPPQTSIVRVNGQRAAMLSVILSFGLPAPIDVQIVGRDYEANRRFASELTKKITARSTDIGALIGSGTAARELFHIAAIDRLRVSVDVPQVYSRAARPGVQATIGIQDLPGRTFTGTVARTAQSIDAGSRTLLVEIDLDNPGGQILPGSFAQVHLKLPTDATTFRLPVNTLIFRSEGLRVAAVKNGTVSLIPITIGRDFGSTVEVIAGLNGSESIVINPSDSLATGQTVVVAPPAEAKRPRP